MVVTIDGPAGAGKSSVARALARRLGYSFLDTGAMYRAVALAAQRRGVPWSDSQGLANLTRRITIRLSDDAVFLDGEDVTRAIRSPDITEATRHVADNVPVRRQLAHLQRQIAQGGEYVTEGRDQGTVVFPDARCKIFLTASAAERAPALGRSTGARPAGSPARRARPAEPAQRA